MKKIEASTLEEAYEIASNELSCSITQLNYEIIQYPSKKLFGFLKKNAIIVATCKESKKDIKEYKNIEIRPKSEAIFEIKDEIKNSQINQEKIEKVKAEDNFTSPIKKKIEIKETKLEKDNIVDSFFDTDKEDDDIDELEFVEESIIYDELALLIENQLKDLLSHSCFDIDIVEVDVRDNTALIFLDGEDAALLIGKEGYRYNALSYMLFNWLNSKYELFIKLEIAEFLTTQQEMIKNYIKPVIENVEKFGRAKTRFLDGILVQRALEQLREKFPDKYVAIKSTKDGKKFVVINQFNSKK